jgi:hypothetical protein
MMTTAAQTERARAIIAETDSALAELEAALAADGRVTLHGDDEHDWTAGDVWAHLGRWLAASADVIGRYLGGEREIHDYDDGERFNLTWIEEDHALPTDAARSRALDAWATLRELIAGVDEGQWNRFIEAYARGNGAGHVLEHLRYVVEAAGVEAPARLERDRGAWASLVAALDARPGVALHDPESPQWTSREIFGHFAHWTEWGIASFEAQRDGGAAPEATETFEEANARWAAEDGGLDLDDLRARAIRTFGARAQLIVSTPAERWTDGMLAAISEDGYDHIHEHHRYIGG